MTETLLAGINNRSLNQKHIASMYADALPLLRDVDWQQVNEAIIARWSYSGLQRVKRMAWGKRHD